MNATEQKQALIEAGYKNYRYQYREYWAKDGKIIAVDDLYSAATNKAYQHYIDSQAQETAVITAAAPVADAPQVESPASDSDKAYIERLEQERTEAQATIAALHAQLKEAQADLSAAQGIIIQAGKDFQALRNENAELKTALDKSAFKQVIIERILWDMVDNSTYWPLDRFRRTAKSALHISPDDVQKEIDAFYSAVEAHKADTPTPCEACNGTGEANMYGEDIVRCDHCKGTGVQS